MDNADRESWRLRSQDQHHAPVARPRMYKPCSPLDRNPEGRSRVCSFSTENDFLNVKVSGHERDHLTTALLQDQTEQSRVGTPASSQPTISGEPSIFRQNLDTAPQLKASQALNKNPSDVMVNQSKRAFKRKEAREKTKAMHNHIKMDYDSLN